MSLAARLEAEGVLAVHRADRIQLRLTWRAIDVVPGTPLRVIEIEMGMSAWPRRSGSGVSAISASTLGRSGINTTVVPQFEFDRQASLA